MGSRDLATFHRDLDLIAGSGTVAGLGDVDLLERFIGGRDAVAEAAFEAIVIRHGPMVQGICRSLLRDPADADDAFQATFLVLVRKARSIRIKDSLRPWLYGVAWRVALKVQAVARRRRSRETSGDLDRAIDPREPDSSDLRPILLEELERLPDRYRIPIVLFHLEGRTHEQVARELRCPVGTISSRLSRARDLLRSRLARRGLGLPVGVVTTALASRESWALPPALIRSTVQASAGGVVSATVHQLVQGVITSMIMGKVKLAGLVLLAGGLAVGAASGRFSKGQEPRPGPKAEAEKPAFAVDPTTGRPVAPETKPIPGQAESPTRLDARFAPVEDDKPPRKASVEAPALTGIAIDGNLEDWPAAMPRYAIKNVHNLPTYYGYNGLAGADLSTSPDLGAAFSVGYDPNEQVIYLAVIVRDDKPIVGHIQFWDTDAIEVYVDGRHSETSLPSFPANTDWDTVEASALPMLQYIGIPGRGRVYGVTMSAGQRRGADNPILMFGDISKTKTRMAYRRAGDVTTYEWAVQSFDRYPDKPTQLVPFKKIGLDIAVVDKDKPAATSGPSTEPEDDRSAWVTWSPILKVPAFLHADRLGEIVLGRIP